MPSSPISPCPSCPPHAAGGHGCAVYSSSVTDAEWAILEPLLPAPGSAAGRGGRPEKHCRRVIVDAILYIVRGGIAWRQLPVEFPPAGTVYAVFARWARSGAWQRMLDALRDRLRVRAGRDRCPTAAIIDSQTVPAADTADYIRHHCKIAGRADTLFSDDAIGLIHNASRGHPRAVNNHALHALTAAFAADHAIVDEKAARIAISETAAD